MAKRRRLQTTDEMAILVVEIMQGLTPAQSSLAPLDDVALEFWDGVGAEILVAQAAGMDVELPPEMPDLTNFRVGFITGESESA